MLGSTLFSELSPKFFGILTGSNARLYLDVILFRDEGGGILLELREQIARKAAEIETLRKIGKSVREEKERRTQATRDFLGKAEDFLAERKAGTVEELSLDLRNFGDASPSSLREALRARAAATRQAALRVRSSVSAESEEVQAARGALEGLQTQIAKLDHNRVIESPLLDELNRQLPRKGREMPARQLRELCEVRDEEWRPALELAFTRKFAIVVSTEDHAGALEIYHAFRKDCPNESLIDPERALARRPKVLENSLATKIEAADPVARAVLDELFGQVICATNLEQLRRHADAIRALRDVDLQGIHSMSSGNWPYAIGECDQVLAVHQRESFVTGRKAIRNIGALLNRSQALERSKEWE